MTFSDTELQSYLANEAPRELAGRIEESLAQDPALEDRLMALDELGPVLRRGLDLLPDATVDPHDTLGAADFPGVARVSFGWLRVAAGFAAGAVLAAALLGAMRPAEADWTMAVAQYQALYSEETIAPLSFGEAELRAQASYAGDRIGADGLFDLTEGLDDLTLLRVQTLELDGAPVIQMVFATADGQPVALCAMAGASGDVDQGAVLREGLASLSFDSANHRWLLIGTENKDLIERAAETLQSRLL